MMRRVNPSGTSGNLSRFFAGGTSAVSGSSRSGRGEGAAGCGEPPATASREPSTAEMQPGSVNSSTPAAQHRDFLSSRASLVMRPDGSARSSQYATSTAGPQRRPGHAAGARSASEPQVDRGSAARSPPEHRPARTRKILIQCSAGGRFPVPGPLVVRAGLSSSPGERARYSQSAHHSTARRLGSLRDAGGSRVAGNHGENAYGGTSHGAYFGDARHANSVPRDGEARDHQQPVLYFYENNSPRPGEEVTTGTGVNRTFSAL